MALQFWLVKQEPEAYPWSKLLADGRTAWTGVRNYQARNNLRMMGIGDLVAYYHSVSEKQLVGVARVARTAYPDPTATDGDWCCVDLEPVVSLLKPVTLAAIKGDPKISDLPLIRQSRLSVMPLTREQFDYLMVLGGTSITFPV